MDILQRNNIPEQHLAMMCEIILFIADHPKSTVEEACFHYAQAHHTSEKAVYRAFRHAVNRGWENAAVYSTLFHSQRPTLDSFVQKVIKAL